MENLENSRISVLLHFYFIKMHFTRQSCVCYVKVVFKNQLKKEKIEKFQNKSARNGAAIRGAGGC